MQTRPAPIAVQFGEPLLMSAIVGARPFAEIETDTADGEMYFGVRATALVDCAGIVRTNLPATKGCEGRALGALVPPPPHAVSTKATSRKDP